MDDYTISSGHFSVDMQATDALRWLESNAPKAHAAVISEFPEMSDPKWQMMGSWLHTDAMGVGVEYGSWLVDAIENTGAVYWEEGEP